MYYRRRLSSLWWNFHKTLNNSTNNGTNNRGRQWDNGKENGNYDIVYWDSINLSRSLGVPNGPKLSEAPKIDCDGGIEIGGFATACVATLQGMPHGCLLTSSLQVRW